MDIIFEIILGLVQPIGNLFVRTVLPKNIIEEGSNLSAFIGGILIILIFSILFFVIKS